ncbi:MAG: hypothetical protein KGI58_03110 [Patescibacteria group bacterium]|nr:hypothetical protein [Patescibacteria group bacterium]
MTRKEKDVLKLSIERKGGLYSPADMINGIASQNRQLVENLVVKGYLEEVPTQIQTGTTYNFYRVSHKGLMVFNPWYKRLWYFLKGDLRTVIVSVITALITTIITIVIGRYIK